MLVHFPFFFISLLASFIFRIVPFKNAEPFFRKGIRRRGSGISFFFFFFPWAKWTIGCGAWQGQKRETQRNVWGATDGALLEGIFSGLFSSHSPTAYYVSFI